MMDTPTTQAGRDAVANGAPIEIVLEIEAQAFTLGTKTTSVKGECVGRHVWTTGAAGKRCMSCMKEGQPWQNQ